jgi:hypothetical protein
MYLELKKKVGYTTRRFTSTSSSVFIGCQELPRYEVALHPGWEFPSDVA